MENIERGIPYLKRKLMSKRVRVLKRYIYYNMKNGVEQVGKMIPKGYERLSETLGWCAKAVDSVADRLTFDGFEADSFNMGEIYRLNMPDIFFDSAILSSLISSCSFIYIGIDSDGYPVLQVIDGAHATGELDTNTGFLTEGYAVLERDRWDKPVLEAYFRPFQTDYYREGRHFWTFRHKAPAPLLVPVINRPDASRPFGHSRITRACMDITQSALRTLLRSEVSAEFYSFPQKYILGLSDNVEFNGQQMSMSSFFSIGKDEDKDKPSVGQFQQQAMTPFFEQLRTLASMFAGETGLTLDDLGFSTANPTASEAIRAAHENLRLTARKAQRNFGTGFVNAGYLAVCLRDGFTYDRRAFAGTKAAWLPVFEPDATALTGIADAVIKIDQAAPGFMGKRNIRRLTGLDSDGEDA